VVATRKARGANDLEVAEVRSMEAWVELYNISSETPTLEGICMLFNSVWTVLSDIKEIWVVGRRAYKAKVRVDLDKLVKDKIEARCPNGEGMLIPVVYENEHRACLFCRLIGHEMGKCMSRNRLLRLSREEEYSARPKKGNILKSKIDAWVTDYTKILKEGGLKKGTQQCHG
jgi:hypothetical protein